MSWRTVVISKRCKLDLKMGYMLIRGSEVKRVFLDEVAVLVLENPAISMTGCLLEALNKKKIRVIFCDGKRSPYGELAPYYGSHDCSRKLKAQAAWGEAIKGDVWRVIIAEKIKKQADHLQDMGRDKESELLFSYVPNVQPQDSTNREGHAAKVYFNAMFGMEFKRGGEDAINASLNYGYGIILSAFNRSITAAGFDTRLGIHHDNVFNFYNLSSDLMEPFRILVDRRVVAMDVKDFTKDVRYYLVNTLNTQVTINGSRHTVLNAIDQYVRSVLAALNGERPELIQFYTL